MSDRAPDNEARYDRIEADLDAATSSRLGGTAGGPTGAPSEESLLRLRRDPGGMAPSERAEIERWFSANPAERDAFEAFRSLAALAKPQPAVRVDWLSRVAGLIAPLTRAPAISAALIVLVAGLSLWQNPFGTSDPRVRGDAGVEATWTVAPDATLRIPRAELPAEGHVTLALELPRGALLRAPVASIQRSGPAAPPAETLPGAMADDGIATVEVPVNALRPGDYRIDLRPSAAAPPVASYLIAIE